MDSIHCARQKAVKLLDELEQEFQLIERRRQGLGKPNLLYVKDLYAGLSQSNYWKYENHTSGGLKNKLPGVLKSNGSNAEKINKTDNSETDLIYPAELQEEEQYRRYFKEALELEILEQGYPADKAVLYELLWRGKAESGGEKPPDEAGFLAYPVHIGVLKRKQHSDSEHSGAVGGIFLTTFSTVLTNLLAGLFFFVALASWIMKLADGGEVLKMLITAFVVFGLPYITIAAIAKISFFAEELRDF